MHFSGFPNIQILNTFLPLNGGTLTPWGLTYTWTVLPQDLQDGLHLFGNALARERRELSLEERALQQSVDHADKQ